jgi:hypothetical protein
LREVPSSEKFCSKRRALIFGKIAVAILLGEGDGTLQNPIDFAVGSDPLSITVGDFNQDGRLDIAVANYQDDAISVLLQKVSCTTPPTLNISLSPNMLWPPNHKLVTITANIIVESTCDPNPSVILVSITSNEPLAEGDIQAVGGGPITFGTDVRSFRLRAKRSGHGNGRTYTVTYRTTDQVGNSTTATATVTVAHDQGDN